jgi:demethylmenaquinone methyltransferase/2-methoxy-6-polyprenyl-1,4-benzoquinol methylase
VGNPAAVRNLFEQVAPRYDQLNDLFSLGLHRLWKRQLLLCLTPRPGEQWLDLCCGTGDLALLLATALGCDGAVLGVDAASAPLAIAKARSARCPWLSLRWLQADALAVPLASGCMDGVVMAYGLRNLAQPAAGLAEMRRLLRLGGRAGVLDFNHTDGPAALLQRQALRRLVVPIASRMGLEQQYAYLEPSIAAFPRGPELEKIALEVGFIEARHRPLAAGLMGMLLLLG